MQHRRKTGPAALRTALGVLLACCALGGTALAAAGGAAGGASDKDPAAAVVQIARQQLGDPYAWGATGPDTWDCSGLTSRLWREVGGVTSIPRVSRDQQAWAVPIPVEQLLVGDLVFFGEPVSHVALYAGDGTIVDASSSQHQVVERRIWTSGVIRYGRVPRPDMPAVKPWTPPSPKPTPSASASAAATPQAAVRASSAATPKPVAKPTAKSVAQPTPKPSPVSTPVTPAVTTAAVALPLRGFPGPDLPALTAVAAQAANNARTVQGSKAWTDVELVRAAWRHAGGQVLPTRRVALVAAGTAVPVSAARIGDLVVYGGPASHVGIYLGHGYMVDASPTYGRVVVRRVFTSPTVRIVRLP